MSDGIEKRHVWEGANITLMARVTKPDGTNITQASISSIAMKVFALSDSAQVGVTAALTVASVVSDSLVTTTPWTKDTTGYNFTYELTGSTYLPNGGETYRIEIVFTLAAGGTVPVVYEPTTRNLLGS